MATLIPLEYGDDRDSLSDFMQELMDKHKNEESKYIDPLVSLIEDFEEYGSRINLHASKKFPPFKTFKGEDFAELRTKECRYFVYHTGNDVWIGLHGYEKQGNDTPRKEKNKAKKKIQLWKRTQKEK